jgi:hypothetical protein
VNTKCTTDVWRDTETPLKERLAVDLRSGIHGTTRGARSREGWAPGQLDSWTADLQLPLRIRRIVVAVSTTTLARDEHIQVVVETRSERAGARSLETQDK